MKRITQQFILAVVLCLSVATHSAANDVQVTIPESSLQIVLDKMIEARAFSPRYERPRS